MSTVPLCAQDTAATIGSEEPNEKAAKYHEALVRRPSGGYLFERFINSWLDTGSVAGLEAFLTRRAEADRETIGEDLLLAYFFSKQSDDEEAVAIFEKALAKDPQNAEAWFEKAKLEARLLNFDKAIADLDKASAAEPKDEVAIEIGKLKGRLLSRAGRGEEALAAWQALASEYADDEELQEDLVELHLAEGLLDEAVALMSDLVEKTDDAYLKITRQLRLGDIYQRSGKREEAIALYGTSLAASGRDTWLEKEILAQIEHVFRREDDIAGLDDHLASLIEAESGRIALMKRRALVLAELQKSDEAAATFAEILKLTPGDRENREAFVDLLGRLEKHDEAAEQLAALAALHPDDAELIAQLAVRQHAAGQAGAAKASVTTYLEESDGSEYSHLRAARLLEQFGEKSAAGEVFAKLVAAFPESVAAKESQAEFLHRAGKKDESIAIWKSLATNGTGQDALRAARALSSRGERQSAYEILKARAEEFAADFAFLGQFCGEAIAVEQFEEALPWAEKRLALVEAPVDLNDAMRLVVSILDRLERIPAHIEALDAKVDRTLPETCLLAELHERNGQYDVAEQTLLPELEAGAILAITQQVRLFRSRDEWAKAAETQRRLVELPGGRNSVNVQDLSQIYRRALKYEEALRWIEEWKKLSPGATQPWVEHSSVLVETDKASEAIAVLRSAVQRFEDQTDLRSQLAGLHLQEGQFADAERLYWTLYEESEEISQKINWAGSLANVASTAGRMETLLEQFEERRRGNRTSIAPLLAIAEIHRRDNNYEGRREALIEATRLRPEDLKLLHEIARIEEEEGDWEGASETLRSALPLDKTENTRERIALMELRYGDEEEGFRQIMDLKGGDRMDADSILGLADAMIARSGWERAENFLASHRARFPDDYRLAYLQAVALVEDGRTEEAQSLFLELLSWDTEIAKPGNATTSRAVPAHVLAAQKAAEAQIPEGTSELTDFQAQTYNALAYRRMLQQQQSNRFQQYSGITGKTSLVRPPASLAEVHGFGKVHLLNLAQTMSDEEIDALASQMTARGVRSADIILKLPFTDLTSGQRSLFPVELLDEYPERLDLWTAAARSQINLIYNSPENIDTDLLGRAYEKFRTDYTELAFSCAFTAACSGTEEGTTLLRNALAELSLPDEPTSLVTSVVANAVRGKAPFTGGRESLLPEEFRAPFIEKTRIWREAARRKAEDRDPTASGQSFLTYDTFSWSLRSLPDLAAFADHLDAEIARYEDIRRKDPTALRMGTTSQFWPFRNLLQNRAILAQPTFPPPFLTDFPPNVLFHFTPLPEYGGSQDPDPLDPEEVSAQVDRVESPVLKVMLAHLAGDDSRTEKEIESLLAAKATSGLPELQIHLLAATFFSSVKNDPDRALSLIEEVRTKPMSKETRRIIDCAIVAYATAKLESDGASESAEESPTLSAGREAALRLRYGMLNPNHRAELVGALTTLGLEDEAGHLRDKAASSTNRSSRVSTSYRNPSVQGLNDRVKKLVADGKMEEATKLSLQSLRPSLRHLASGNAGGRVDSTLMQLVQYLSKEATLLTAVKEELEPGDPQAAKAEDLFERAALHELLGEFDDALEVYRAGLRALGTRKRPGIETRILAILCYAYPKNAANSLAEIDPVNLRPLTETLQFIESSERYVRSDRDSQFARNMNLGRAFTFWLQEVDESALARIDLSPLDYPVRHKVADQFSGGSFSYMPGLYYDLNPRNSWNRNRSQLNAAKAKEATRREIHDELCRAMVRSPQTARRAFSYFAGVRLNEDAEKAAADPELESLAQLALTNAAKPFRGGPGQFSQHSRNFNRKSVVPWSPEDFLIWLAVRRGEASAESTMELVSATKQRDLIQNAGRFHDLAFCPPAEFETVAKDFVRKSWQANQNHGGGRVYATEEALAVPEKLFAIWEARREDLTSFDMAAFSVEVSQRAAGAEALLPILLFEKTIREEDFDAARPVLENLALALIGERERWGEFKKSAQQRVPTSSGGYYMQGGEFTNPRHILFAELMQRLCNGIDTALPVASFLRDEALDTNAQVTESTLVANLSSPRLSEDPETTLTLFKTSPFFRGVETFRSLDSGRSNALRDILEQVKKSGPAKNRLREAALETGSFGGSLVAAYLSPQPKLAVAEVLGNHRKEVEATLEKQDTGDLAAFVNSVYNDGGVDFDNLSEDARGVLDLLGTERAKTAREAAAEFLTLKDLKSIGIDNDSKLEKHLLTLLPPLWSAGEWDLGVKVYWQAMNLARREIKVGAWNGSASSGWTIEGNVLYDVMNSAPGSDLERIALFERILASDEDGRVPVTAGGMGFAGDLRNVFDRSGGEARAEAAMEATVAALHELCGNDPSVRLSLYLTEMAFRLRPALAPRLVAWADSKSEGQPWSPIAKELGQALRMGMQTSRNAAYDPLWPQVENIETWQDHYIALLEDDSRTLPWRLAVADEVCDADADASIRPDTAMACTSVLAEVLAADAPANTWHVQRITMQFNKLDKTPEWKTLARRLRDGWTFKNRNNQKPTASGLAFRPGTECVLAMLETHLKLGDPESTRKFRTEKHAFERIKANARTLVVLVTYGDFEGAAHVLREGIEFQDIMDDYMVPATHFQMRYSQRTHEQLPLFLETVEDPAMRYFAELLVLGALDPVPELREAEATYPARGARVTEAAKRFAEIDFAASPRGPLIRERVLQQIASTDPSFAMVASIWEKEYLAEDCLAYCNLGNYKKIEHASRPLGAFAALRLRTGDPSVVKDMIVAANESAASENYRREALEHFTFRLVESLKHRGPRATPEEWLGYAAAFGLLLSETNVEVLEHDNLVPLIGAYLTASAKAGSEAEFTAWTNALPPDRAEKLATNMRRRHQPLWRSFAQILKTKAPNPDLRPTPEAREKMLATLFAHPLMDRAYRLHDPLFRLLVDHGLLTVEEIRGEPGKRLETLFPRSGYTALEIARYHADAGDRDAALEWGAKAVTLLDPAESPGPFARVALGRIELLLEARRESEAAKAIGELQEKVDVSRIAADLRQTIASMRERIKI